MGDSTIGMNNQEWLSNILRRFKLSPLQATLMMAVLHLVVDIPMWFLFRETIAAKGLAIQPSDVVYELLVHPLILGYFCWFQGVGNRLFSELTQRHIISSESHLQNVIAESSKWLQSKWVGRVALAITLLSVCWIVLAFAPLPGLQPYPEAPYPSWITAHPAIVWSQVPGLVIVIYALLLTVYDVVIIIIALYAAFRNQEIRVEPLNPDKAGGLGFIGRFSANLCYLIGAIGLLQSVRTVQAQADLTEPRNYMFVVGFVLYLLLAPSIFFIPLWTSHAAMKRYRDSLLADVSKRFDAILSRVRSLRQEGDKEAEALLGEMQQLDEMRTLIAKQTPVWPFNVGSVRKFFGLVFSPILPAVTSYMEDYVTNLLRR